MIAFIINLLIFAYAVGVFGVAVSGSSMYYRFRPSDLRTIPILILFSFLPVANYRLMWEGFKTYDSYLRQVEIYI